MVIVKSVSLFPGYSYILQNITKRIEAISIIIDSILKNLWTRVISNKS